MGGRKAEKKAALEGFAEPQGDQIIMRVVALRGSNLVEVEDGKCEKTLCLMPAKFSKSLWIKRGNFVLVDEGDRQKVLEAHGKVTGTIAQVLYKDQVRLLQKTRFWPEGFEKSGEEEPLTRDSKAKVEDSEEDDDLPALEKNTNRCEAYCPSSESDEDSESE